MTGTADRPSKKQLTCLPVVDDNIMWLGEGKEAGYKAQRGCGGVGIPASHGEM